jgi:hypothetical protein
VTVTLTSYEASFDLIPQISAGQLISFYSQGGTLPSPIISGKRYFVRYGSIVKGATNSGQISFNLSETGVWGPPYSQTVTEGQAVNTTSAGSGIISYSTYGDSWTDFVLDPGVYLASSGAFLGQGAGLKKLRILAYGARIHTMAYVGGNPETDVNSAKNPYAFTALFKTPLSTGQYGTATTSVELVTHSEAANYHVNSWVILSCYETMPQYNLSGNFNQYTFEFAKVKSVDLAGGIIYFQDAIQYGYRSTAPAFYGPSGIVYGPAMIHQLSEIFDQEIEIHGLTVTSSDELNYLGVLSLRCVDCEFFGWGYKTGPFPSEMRRSVWERCKFHGGNPPGSAGITMEVDKVIDVVYFNECEFDQGAGLVCSSASVNRMVINRSRLTGGITETPKDLTVRDSFFSSLVSLGPLLGAMERATFIDTHVTHLDWTRDGNEGHYTSEVTFSNGVLQVPSGSLGWAPGGSVNSANPMQWAVPGTKGVLWTQGLSASGDARFNVPCYLDGSGGIMLTFVVLNVYMDSSNNYCVSTTLKSMPTMSVQVTGSIAAGTNTLSVTGLTPSGACLPTGMTITGPGVPANTTITTNIGIPNYVNNIGNYLLNNTVAGGSSGPFTASFTARIWSHPCPRLTAIGCTGGAFLSDLSGSPADGPMWSYFRRGYGGLAVQSYLSTPGVILCGNLISWEIDVISPHTDSLVTTYQLCIGIFGYANSGGNWYPTFVNQVIDLKQTGKRTIGPTAGTTTGALTGDTLVPVPFFMTGRHAVIVGPNSGAGNLAQMPYFIMTGRAKQGVEGATMVISDSINGIDRLADSVFDATFN